VNGSAVLVLLATFAALTPAAERPPDFARDVAPIVYRNCAPCHRTGGAGPFPLTSYADVRKHATQIATVTARRYMPPWLPQPGYGEFRDEPRLTAEQIRIISDWVRAGAPEGPASEIPTAPEFSNGWQLGQPDLILKAKQPFTVPAGGPDVFWNFIFNPEIKTRRYVRAIEIRPGRPRLVHHANLLIDRSGSLRSRAGRGFGGMDFTLDRNPLDPESHFLFWKPGSIPYSEPDGLAWRLDPGNLLVLNTHLQPAGKLEELQPEVGLYFTEKPATRFPILVQLEHDGALDIPPGSRDFVISDDFRLPVDADVLAIYPHAHYLGKLIEAYATLPNGSRVWLIRIPDWNLKWQAVYRYRTPVFLPKGTVLSMRIHYDNSATNPRNPNRPPTRVRAGNNATDEMGHVWLQILPRGRGDQRRTVEEALMRHRLEKYPSDFSAHLNLGALMLSRLDAQGAVSMLTEAVRMDPNRPEAHDMLGAALQNLGRLPDAIREYRLALKADPSYWSARYNLARALAKSGDVKGALENLRQVVAAYPDDKRLQAEYSALLATHASGGR
jgi:mono/diheme cytochrome c family protein